MKFISSGLRLSLAALLIAALMLTVMQPQSAFAESTAVPIKASIEAASVDFEITESITMSSGETPNSLTITDLVISNTITDGIHLDVQSIDVVPIFGWSIVPNDTDFSSKLNKKQFSVITSSHDFADGSLTDVGTVEIGKSLTVQLDGKVSTFTSKVKEKAANFVVTVSAYEPVAYYWERYELTQGEAITYAKEAAFRTYPPESVLVTVNDDLSLNITAVGSADSSVVAGHFYAEDTTYTNNYVMIPYFRAGTLKAYPIVPEYMEVVKAYNENEYPKADGYGYRKINLISFTTSGLNGTPFDATFEAVEGMTWAEFIESEYNPTITTSQGYTGKAFILNSSGYVYSGFYSFNLALNGTFQKGTDTVASAAYNWEYD